MRFARGLVLLLALCAGTAAAVLVHKATRNASRPAAAMRPEMVDILVAARPVAVGETVSRDDVRWQPWPGAALPAGSIRRAQGGGAFPFEAAPARFALMEGEPLSQAKLLRPDEGSALAALLAPGMRAVSVSIREETAAGGFIQPGDRVDVMVTRKQGDAGREPSRAETLLRGVKVLAIGKALQAKVAASAGGRTATLELAPAQAGLLATAQVSGEVALALIGTADRAQADAGGGTDLPSGEVRVLKYGRSANRQQ